MFPPTRLRRRKDWLNDIARVPGTEPIPIRSYALIWL
jgi:hypothetical protein